MKTLDPQIVFQEVPDHVSIAFLVSGCPLKCVGCHSQDIWNPANGNILTNEKYLSHLKQYEGLANCVLFFGGEWYPKQLIEKLSIAKMTGYKTCLYSGFKKLPKAITAYLDFLKTGPWIPELGGLDNSMTNQRFIALKTGEVLNHKFR